jgi:hypothetical protein
MWATKKLGEKLQTSHPKNRNKAFDIRKEYRPPIGGYTSRSQGRGEVKRNICIACTMKEIPITGQGIVQSSWNPRKR